MFIYRAQDSLEAYRLQISLDLIGVCEQDTVLF